MNELDNEDSKKDTLVDVVFKKALKEFRQNIFSFYSSALAVSDQLTGENFHLQEKRDALGPPGGGDVAELFHSWSTHPKGWMLFLCIQSHVL